MNPIAFAKSIGYDPKQILEYLAKTIPGFESKVAQATAAGYGIDQVIEFFQKQSQGQKVDRRTQKYLQPALEDEAGLGPRGKMPQRRKTALGEMAPLAAGAAGAAVGAALGGPMGAVEGAAAGWTSVNDVMSAYDRHKAQGGSLGIGDFMKAAAKGVGSVALARSLRDVAKNLGKDQDKEESSVEVAEAEAEVKPAAPSEPVSPEEPERDLGAETLQAIQQRGAANIFVAGVEQLESPAAVQRFMEHQYKKRWLKDLAKELGTTPEKAIEAAYNTVTSAGETQAREEPKKTQETQLEIADTTEAGPEQVPTVEQDDVKPLYTGKGHPDLQAYVNQIGKIDTGPRKDLTRDVKELRALKSSNVRYADYDPEEEKLQVLFAPSGKAKEGAIYEYFDVPREDVEKMMKGSGTAVTTGANQFRAWFGGKNPSIGRAFHDFIKKTDDKGDAVYPYRKISEKYVKDVDLLKVRGADTVFKTTQYVDAFEDLVLKSQAKTRAEGLKMVNQSLKELPDDLLESMIFEVTKGVGQEVKEARKKGKQKRFKGGKEAEIRKRIEERAQATRDRGGG